MAFPGVAGRMRRALGLATGSRAHRVEQLRFVLPDLRTADPGFLLELRDGRLPLTGDAVTIGAEGPFVSDRLPDAARRELYAFGWLRHLTATRSVEAEEHARRLLLAWSRSAVRRGMLANEPAVAARRVLSLLAHLDLALAGASAADFDRLMALLVDEVTALAEATPRMPLAHPRLTALIALTAFQICGHADQGAERSALERRLATELNRQILPDGGHISRNPAVALDLALDLLPLHRSYLMADLTAPAALGAALSRLGSMLNLLSHQDRQLGRFNGMGATAMTDLAMVAKTLPSMHADVGTLHAQDSGYVRLVNGDALVLFDAGPGNDTLAGEAPVAGALSFEFSAGRSPFIVNTGSSHGPFGVPRLEARTTGSQSALVLGDASSAPPTGARGGSTRVALVQEEGDSVPLTIKASLDGYRQRFGYVHHRSVSLLREGWLLEGVDTLEPVPGATVQPVTFAVRFHLHPTVHVAADPASQTLRLTLADGSRWLMAMDGATALLEPSVFHAAPSGPRPTLQIVLKGPVTRATKVTWRFERMSPSAVS